MYDHPFNIFVAGFIGSPSMNFFDSRLVVEGESMFVDTGIFRLGLPADKRAKLREQGAQEVILGIRPEDVYDRALVPQSNSQDVASVGVEVVEHMGSEIYVYLMGGKTPFVARLDPRSKAVANKPLDVFFDATHVHLFDKNTQGCLTN